ncbi:ATP-binding cassette domain-containing protein [Marinomonas mediterranea]|jgi:ATPase components of ABC transporters with duplicated ATPase domains|uniref:ATP-binding protein Uup n=1 Tax=Marinomonas mediterranea (strain ATCC 700492 / JCM 21426 / NBRC 103028 / MMB-1) TaxID=717774 RepID=F2K3Z2_MARM1|nr:ATP-binding cassette domain-containing protein [Marinomonas mediterranea]ADZ91334.1 ABC transporter related protein [Marinomonas mediterranea MMB-1]WCN17454.1 ATP-binding cassette domain-containing protein [Marinomonas mediterranea MMB-1]
MSLLSLDQVSVAFGHHPLLSNISFSADRGERVAIIGRNGAGKSTFLKIVFGEQIPDDGIVRIEGGMRVAQLPQELPAADGKTVRQVVSEGAGETHELLNRYFRLLEDISVDHSDELSAIQTKLDETQGWDLEQRVNNMIQRLALPADKLMSELSGGWRRRVILAQALLSAPDILLLDEPTNHLDVPTIEWMESQLKQFRGLILFITHDRRFLENLANRIVELDRGNLLSFTGRLSEFLVFKEKQLEEEERANALFDKKLAEEEVWIRQGIKARRTRNEGRVRALKALREERSERVNRQGNAKMKLGSNERSGKLVAEFNQVAHAFDDKTILKPLDLVVSRGDRIGLIGPNGCGKSTFLKILLGQLEPSSGTVRQGTKLNVAYFDQLREQLDPEKTVADNVGEGKDTIEIEGRSRHIIGYLQDFLFPPERARTPVKALSGGERNRVLLAKLFTKPANLLVMDEPTNDLDVETLELLEELLTEYQGTLLLVSHDRAFLDNVVTSVIAFEGQGIAKEYVGGYQDWVRQGGQFPVDKIEKAIEKENIKETTPVNGDTKVESSPAKEETAPAKKKSKLSYKLQREFDLMPDLIAKLESDVELLQETTSAADFYAGDQTKVQDTLAKMAAKEEELELAMERWLELEEMQNG